MTKSEPPDDEELSPEALAQLVRSAIAPSAVEVSEEIDLHALAKKAAKAMEDGPPVRTAPLPAREGKVAADAGPTATQPGEGSVAPANAGAPAPDALDPFAAVPSAPPAKEPVPRGAAAEPRPGLLGPEVSSPVGGGDPAHGRASRARGIAILAAAAVGVGAVVWALRAGPQEGEAGEAPVAAAPGPGSTSAEPLRAASPVAPAVPVAAGDSEATATPAGARAHGATPGVAPRDPSMSERASSVGTTAGPVTPRGEGAASETAKSAGGEAPEGTASGEERATPPAPTAAPPAPARPGSALDDVLDQALGGRPAQGGLRTEPAAPPAGAPSGPVPSTPAADPSLPAVPPKAEVGAILGGLMPAIRQCAGDQQGFANAVIMVRSDGTVGSASVSGHPFGSTPQGACMESVFKGAKFSPFKNPSFMIKYPFAVR